MLSTTSPSEPDEPDERWVEAAVGDDDNVPTRGRDELAGDGRLTSRRRCDLDFDGLAGCDDAGEELSPRDFTIRRRRGGRATAVAGVAAGRSDRDDEDDDAEHA